MSPDGSRIPIREYGQYVDINSRILIEADTILVSQLANSDMFLESLDTPELAALIKKRQGLLQILHACQRRGPYQLERSW